MPAAPDCPEVTAWVDATHARHAGSLLDVMGDAIELIGLGGPDAAAADLGRDAGLRAESDLRRLLLEKPADCLLVASRGGVSREFLEVAAEQETRVVTTEPAVDALRNLDAGWVAPVAATLLEVPRFDRSPGVEAALDPLSAVEGPLQARLLSHGRPDEGSLFGRLLEAWRTVLRFVDLPESLLAAWTPPPGDAPLREARGRVAVLARCRGGATVSLDVAADAARSRQSLRLLGADAQVEVTAERSERLPLGDEAFAADAEAEPPPAASFVDRVAGRWRRSLHHPTLAEPGPAHDAPALACIEAMRLSARTGQPESPGRLLRLRGAG